MSDSTDINTLRRILRQYKTIAVVGLSANWYRPSFFAAKYMQEHGYRVIPVNPSYPEILGEKCYASLKDIPEKVDVVDCFCKSADIEPIADQDPRSSPSTPCAACRRTSDRAKSTRARRSFDIAVARSVWYVSTWNVVDWSTA